MLSTGLIALAAAAFSLHAADAQPTVDLASQRVFDFFLLVREWDPGYCATTGCNPEPTRANFTLHGLWPEYAVGRWPQDCPGPEYEDSKLDEIRWQLEQEWPSFQKTGPEFWEHEWKKHGTCAHTVLKDELTYFSKVLELHERYDFLSALEANDLSPSDDWQHSVLEVKAAFDKVTGVEGSNELDCKPLYEQNMLTEVKTCLNKSFKPIRCPKHVGEGACQPVIIPTLQSLSTPDDVQDA